MTTLTILKILMNPSFRDSKIAIMTSHNITLKRGVSHQQMSQLLIIQKVNPCLTSWIQRKPSQKTKKMILIPLDTLNAGMIMIKTCKCQSAQGRSLPSSPLISTRSTDTGLSQGAKPS
jgi:hypothetical protein